MSRPFSQPGFNGHHLEAAGWYHLGNGHRVYSPLLMRFHCPDRLSPFGAGGLNAYAYCLGDPVNRRDPTGRATEDIHIVSLVVAGISIGYGFMSLIVPPLARLARPGSRVHGWASMGPPLSSSPGGLDAAATIAGIAGGGLGAAATKLSMEDPESRLAKDLTHISLYTTLGVLVTGRLVVGVTPAKDFTSHRWRTVGKFVHGPKKIERNEQPRLNVASMNDPDIEMRNLSSRRATPPILPEMQSQQQVVQRRSGRTAEYFRRLWPTRGSWNRPE